jgi:hypothetical protein
MTQPALAKQTRDGGRTYVWPPTGVAEPEFEVVSVSGVTGIYPKPWLTPWAVKMTAKAAIENYEQLGQRIQWDKDAQKKGNKGGDAERWLKNARWDSVTPKGDRGTIVHAAIQSFLEGRELTKADIDGMLAAASVPFKMWPSTHLMVTGVLAYLHEHEPEVYWAEQTVFSRAHGYAGTPDIIGRANILGKQRAAIFDVKTGSGIKDDMVLQLCGYARADFVGGLDGTEHPLTPDGEPIEWGVIIQPKANGSFDHAIFKLDDEVFALFLGCCEVARREGAIFGKRRA